MFATVSDEDIDRITHLNAMDWFSYDPFSVLDRAECTVGALRASVAGHDVSIQSRDTGRHGGKNTSLQDFAVTAGSSATD